MRIIVCIKQVPVLSAMQFDPATKRLKRAGVPAEVSAFDVRAVLKAVALKQEHGGEVAVLTMGPPGARDALMQCLALGADRGIHLCDPAFAGADTLATARALAAALRREPFDLVLCGRNSVDAETGQVGPALAELLDVPQITAARTLTIDVAARTATAERETDHGTAIVRVPLPALITAAEDLAPERFASRADRESATAKPVSDIHAADLGDDLSAFGLAGSPTWVADLITIETHRRGQLIEAATVAAAAAEMAAILTGAHGLFGAWRVDAPPPLATVAPTSARAGAADVWVIAESDGSQLRPATFELLGKASDLAHAIGGHVGAVVIGRGSAAHVSTLAAHGADVVYVADHAQLAEYDTEQWTSILAAAVRQQQPGIVLSSASMIGRDFMPRLAARRQAGLTGDCIDLGIDTEGRLVQYKPAFGGSVVAPILSRTLPEMATVRPGMLTPLAADASRRARVETLPTGSLPPPRATVISQTREPASAGDLDTAEVVIGVGKGVGSREHMAQLRPLADLLRAALCATRDVTDAGWLPKQHQVGLTGRAIAPKLYIAVGVRGAFEHTVGIRRAGVVVAINKNPKAPMFKSADYGVVADWLDFIPALTEALAARQRPSL